VVGAHRAGEAGVVQRAQHGVEVDVPEPRRVRRLVELPRPGERDVAAVREVDAPARAQPPRHRRQVVGGVRAERARAERDAVGRAVHEVDEPLEGGAARDDPRQPEDGPGGIVGVDRHLHPHALGHRRHPLEEVREVLPQPLGVHVRVGGEQRLQRGRVVRGGPAGQVAGAAREVDARQGGVVVREREGAVVELEREVGARPVEYGHEVVAQHRHAQLAHVPHALAVVVDQAIARGAAELDVLVHRDALDDRQPQPRGVDRARQPLQLLARPGRAHRHVVERAHHAAHARDLPHVRERDRVVGPEPAEGHLHGASPGVHLRRRRLGGTAGVQSPSARAIV
jgi:hypothetical protein